MTDNSPKTKRRPPAEKPTDGAQDADWGFDAGAADPSIEKKLGVVLVVCLLAGFGFVFFQKYRLLQNGSAQAQTENAIINDADHGDPGESKSPQKLAATAESTALKADRSPETSSNGPVDEIEPATEPEWLLTQAEVPQPAASPSTLAPSNSAGSSQQSVPDTFDPFAAADAAPDSPSLSASTAATNPQESTSDALTWDEPLPGATSTAAHPEALQEQSEPDPFFGGEPQVSAAPPAEEVSQFGVEAATDGTDDQQHDEPLLTLNEQSEPLEAMPQSEPEVPAASPRQLTFLDEAPAPAEPSVSEPAFDPFLATDEPTEGDSTETAPAPPVASFDPFSSDEASTAAVASAPEPEEAPMGDAAAPADDMPTAVQPDLALPPQQPVAKQEFEKTIVDPPAWPFSETANSAATGLAASPSIEPARPVEATPAQAPQWPSSEPASTSPLTSEAPPNPFSFDATTSRPIAGGSLQPQPTIGVREITVTPSDTFWSIAEREYGSARYFNALAQYNKEQVPAPEKLRAGMKIRIPPPEVLEDTFPQLFRAAAAGPPDISPISGSSMVETADRPGLFVNDQQQPHYRVGERDTLSSIAKQSLGRSSRWTEIYDLNRDQLKSPSTLKIGMVLKLPPEAGGVAVSPAGGFFR